MHRRTARADEALVKFIGDRVDCDEQDGKSRFAPRPPRARIIFFRLTQRAQNHQRENRVFCQMRAFSDGCYNPVGRARRNVRKEPMQKRPDDSRCMLEGTAVARRGKNHEHPDQDRQPVFEQQTNARHMETNKVSPRDANLLLSPRKKQLSCCGIAFETGRKAKSFSVLNRP